MEVLRKGARDGDLCVRRTFLACGIDALRYFRYNILSIHWDSSVERVSVDDLIVCDPTQGSFYFPEA